MEKCEQSLNQYIKDLSTCVAMEKRACITKGKLGVFKNKLLVLINQANDWGGATGIRLSSVIAPILILFMYIVITATSVYSPVFTIFIYLFI